MNQHPNCTKVLEDFNESIWNQLCEDCLRWGTNCFGGAHMKLRQSNILPPPAEKLPEAETPILKLKKILKESKAFPDSKIHLAAAELSNNFTEDMNLIQRYQNLLFSTFWNYINPCKIDSVYSRSKTLKPFLIS